MLGGAGQHLAGGDRRVELRGQRGVAFVVVGVQRLLDPHQVEVSNTRHMRCAVGRSHCWLASTISGAASPRCLRTAWTRLDVQRAVGLTHLELDAADARMHDQADNVAIVANDGGLPQAPHCHGGLVLVDRVPQGHKVALVDCPQTRPCCATTSPLAMRSSAIPAGSWVHERLLQMPDARELDGPAHFHCQTPPLPPLEGYTFEGYRNADGSVGTRNILAITTTVQCVAGVVDFAVQRIKAELLPRSPTWTTWWRWSTYGCGVAIDAPGAEIPIRTLRNISLNPNFGGEVMVVSLGCEKLQPERLAAARAPFARVDERQRKARRAGRGVPAGRRACGLHVHDRFHHASGQEHLQRLNARRRETVPASELVVGVQCGGSDAFSGVTANPAVGFCTDLLVRAGASVMFSETTEVRDGIDQLTSRAATPEVAEAMIREMAWYDAYLQRGSVDRSANTTPGNKKGGLSNIVEKGHGLHRQVGLGAHHGVLAPGEKLTQKGPDLRRHPRQRLHLRHAATGGRHEPACVHHGPRHALWAGGVPVIKVATRTDLARRWHDLMDVNAGTIADGTHD
jgi:galactarate dehydratase